MKKEIRLQGRLYKQQIQIRHYKKQMTLEFKGYPSDDIILSKGCDFGAKIFDTIGFTKGDVEIIIRRKIKK